MTAPDTACVNRIPQIRDDLMDAVIGLDEARMRRIILSISQENGPDLLISQVLVPTLRAIGEMWSAGFLSVMHEHHASSTIRSVIGEVRRRDTASAAPRVVLACPPGELHDLPAHMFGLMLIHRGMDPVVLGANTPVGALAQAVRSTQAASCVLIARKVRSVNAYESALSRISQNTNLFIAGPAATAELHWQTGLQVLAQDWIGAAESVRDASRGTSEVGH